MGYAKAILGIFAAMVFAVIFPGLPGVWKTITEQKASGMDFVLGGLVEAFFSLRFWILTLLSSTFLFGASRIENPLLRVLLLWVPAVLLSALGLSISALLTYMFVRRHG